MNVKVIHYNGHTFLCFDDKSIVHNPDCICAFEYEGYLHTPLGMQFIELFRKNVDHYN